MDKKPPLDPRFTPQMRSTFEDAMELCRMAMKGCFEIGVAHKASPRLVVPAVVAGMLAMLRDTEEPPLTNDAVLEMVAKLLKGIRWSTDPEDTSGKHGSDDKGWWYSSS